MTNAPAPAKVYPSLLAANHSTTEALCRDMRDVSGAADGLHYDVMQRPFVAGDSPITPRTVALGAEVAPHLARDVPLMVPEPGAHMIEEYAGMGAQWLTIHVEAYETGEALGMALQRIKAAGMRAGLALNPDTALDAVKPFLEHCDLVLLMTVVPGFGAQPFIEGCLPKIRALTEYIRDQHLPVMVGMDGGIKPETALKCIEAAAPGVQLMFVAGSSVFGKPGRAAREAAVRGLAL